MKKTVLISCIFINSVLYAQNQDTTSIKIQVVCGFGASTSSKISYYKGIIQSKKFVLLKSGLFSENDLTKILSFISLQELKSKSLVTLTAEEQTQMTSVKQMNKQYSLCYTCTGHYKGSIKKLLSRKDIDAYEIIKHALFDSE